MDKYPKHNDLTPERTIEYEATGKDNSEPIGDTVLRIGNIVSDQERKSQTYKTRLQQLIIRNGNGEDVSDEAEQVFDDYLNAIKDEDCWEEGLSFLADEGILDRYVILECLKNGMPASIINKNSEYRKCLVDSTSYIELPEGVLSEIYYDIADDEEAREQFKNDFIVGHKVDRAIAGFIYDASCKSGELSEKQKNDILVFQMMGGETLDALARNAYGFQFMQSEADESPEDSSARIREVGKNAVEYLVNSGMCDKRAMSDFFGQTVNSIGIASLNNDVNLGMIDAILNFGGDLDLTGDAEYWFKICSERKENVLDRFAFLYRNKGEMLNGLNLENEVVLRTLAKTLNVASTSGWDDLYREMSERDLLNSTVFQEELLKAIGEQPELRRGLSSNSDVSLAVRTLMMKRGLIDEVKEKGLFEKYPDCLKNEVLRQFVNGEKTERDRLGLFLDTNNDSRFDENGEPNDAFYDGVYDIRKSAVIFSDEEMQRTCEVFFEKGKYDSLLDAGEKIWEKGNLSDHLIGFLKMYNELSLGAVLGKEDIQSNEVLAKLFDKNGAKEEFWRKCIVEKRFDYLATLDKDILHAAGCDKHMWQIFRGLRPFEIGDDGRLDEETALSALVRFIKMDAIDWGNADEADLKIKNAFAESNIANKDVVMRQLREIYDDYLNAENGAKMPSSIRLLIEFMHKNGGVGPLTQIETFLDYCGELDKVEDDAIRVSTKGLEGRIKNWDNVSRTNFYATAAEILKADEQIYAEFLGVFERIENEEDFRIFTQEIFPLYRAKLALLKEYDDYSNGVGGYQSSHYRNIDREQLRNDLHNALIPFTFLGKDEGEGDESFKERREKGIELVKGIIFDEITELFTEKFGILPEAIPHELDKEGMRAIEDMVLYLSNIAKVDGQKKGMIGFYLALCLSKREDGGSAWDDFRKGVNCDPFDYLTPDVAKGVADAIWRSGERNPITAKNTHIEDPERLKEFRSALQDDVSEIRVGGMSTIDVKLQNLCSNIEELADPDLYDTMMDKAKVRLISQYSPKMIGKVATALWLREAKGREPNFSEDETILASELKKLLTDEGIEFTPANIQRYLQQGFKELGPVAKTLSLIREHDVRGKVAKLQDMLIPSGEVAMIFGELGEEFKPKSGVFALNADLEFLQSVIAKGEKAGVLSGDATERQRKLDALNEYLATVEASMSDLNAIYDEIVKSFDSIRISDGGEGGNQNMAIKLQEIRDIISGKSESSYPAIVSNCSNDIKTIIENMRACLSCKIKGINNDTDLTFGEGYKFYSYSQTGAKEKGSISDEIVFFVPTRNEEGEQKMSFVMDKIYGTANSDILLGHIGVMVKKVRALRERFPEVPISIIITSSMATSCSVPTGAESLLAQLRGIEGVEIEQGNRIIDIPESGYGDHYIEIGGGERVAGEREVLSVEIIFK